MLSHGVSGCYNLFLAGGLKKNAMTSTVTGKDVEKAVGKWLIGARDRGGNRLARATKNATPEQGPENEDN